jgi:hypothetical protein
MRNILLAILVAVLPASGAVAQQQSSLSRPDKPAPGSEKLLPLKSAGTGAGRSCTEYGPGFVQLAGSSTCVKIGGAVSVEVGGSGIGR